MWPFKKQPPPRKPVHFSTTSLQIGDECVCVDDRPHDWTHQKLLNKGQTYTVREVYVKHDGNDNNGYGGPFIRLVGIMPANDQSWDSPRFEKVVRLVKKEDIIEQVKLPVSPSELDVEKEKQEAY